MRHVQVRIRLAHVFDIVSRQLELVYKYIFELLQNKERELEKLLKPTHFPKTAQDEKHNNNDASDNASRSAWLRATREACNQNRTEGAEFRVKVERGRRGRRTR